MVELPPFVKFKQNRFSWANYPSGDLGTHIDYCESHIEICEQLIADQNGNEASFYVIISKRAEHAHNPDQEFIYQGINEDPPPSHSSHSEPLCCCIYGKENGG
jgi:hypothetical protein